MNISKYLDLYIFPTGRRAYAQAQLVDKADQHDVANLYRHAKAAVEHEREVLHLEAQRKAADASDARFSPEMVSQDNQLDRALTGFEGYLESQERMNGEDSEVGKAAATVRKTVLPGGAGDITSLPFESQDAAVATLLEQLGAGDLAKLIALLPGGTQSVAMIREHHEEYRRTLGEEVVTGPTREQLRAMQLRGQELLEQSLVLILAHNIEHGDDAVTRDLLAPIERQSEAIRARRQRRRQPTDVDPDSGEELPPGEQEVPEAP